MSATILVVEDEPAIRELIAYNLKQAGLKPLCADSAEQALRLVTNTLPDLILLDWMLPGASGIDVAKRLRVHIRTKPSRSSCSVRASSNRTSCWAFKPGPTIR